MSSENKRTFPCLTSANWGQWADNMEAYLNTKELCEYVDGTMPKPVPGDPSNPTAEELDKLANWKRKAGKASGEIWLAIEDDQKVHVKDVKGDPTAMWVKLESVHVQKRPGARFNAYDSLFSIRKNDDETLPALMARADKALQDIKSLRSSNFTLNQLDNELECMALIRALPAEYNTFVSSLLLLDSLDLDKLKSAFQNEESQRLARNVTASSPSLAMSSTNSSSTARPTCFFCGGLHFERDCNEKRKASEAAKKQLQERKSRFKRKEQAKDAKDADTATSESAQGKTAQIEFAGHASALSSSTRSQWLKSRACADWNTDTGASSHMTPHKHWFRSYSPHVVAIKLADHSTIYSAGIGSVEFQPVIDGIPERPVVFHDVLHVPDLASNLLSLLHLACVKGYVINIESDCLRFYHSNQLHFTASVTPNNVGYLDGQVIVPKQAESARFASTCPLDLTLWHRRCSHINFEDLKHMHSHNLVSGMVIRSTSPPDPICEPCILGKQRRHNIPKTATRRTSLLSLVHSDLKGPLPVQTLEGYRYWQTFVDDKSRYLVVAFLKRKSEALVAFKQFKAYAENLLGRRIQMSRDDKGGEFISTEFNQFCADEGIKRQHSEPNEPHQNGVAERSNEDIAAGATALLVQAKLPPSFWRYAVSTYVHTRNRTPTSALNGDTPYYHWKGKKPDISYFRIFGCLAYVLIRKEKRKALQPHSKRCIFIGYPDGVKAWQFWDPIDKKVIISSHAVFDERCFPGNSTTAINLISTSLPVSSPPTRLVVLDQGGDDSNDTNTDKAPLAPIPAPAPLPPPAADPAPAVPPIAPVPDVAHVPAPAKRQNPPRSSRPQGSLNETLLRRQASVLPLQSPSPAPPPSTSASTPDPLLMSPPAAAPVPLPPLSPVNESGSEDELLLKDSNDDGELEYADSVEAGLQYLFSCQEFDYLTLDQAMEYAFTTTAHAFKTTSHDGEPNTYHQAMQRSAEEKAKWHKAALDEIQSLIENRTFELVQLPPGQKSNW